MSAPRYVTCEDCPHPHYDIANGRYVPCLPECKCDRYETDQESDPEAYQNGGGS